MSDTYELIYGENLTGHQSKVLAEKCTVDEAFSAANKFLNEHSVEDAYWRVFFQDNPICTVIDFGSHTKFFYIKGLTEEECLKYLASD